jgi:Ca-activated chloride channel family protein
MPVRCRAPDPRHPDRPIDEVRAASSSCRPPKHRRVGLITYGPGPYNQCNVKLDLKPTADAFKQIMRAVNGLVPAGKTPLTSAVEKAAEVLNYRSKPGVIVLAMMARKRAAGHLRTGQQFGLQHS